MIPTNATTTSTATTVLPLSSTTAATNFNDDEDVTAATAVSCGGGCTAGGTPKRRKRTVITTTTASTTGATTTRTMMVHPPLRMPSFGRRGRALFNRFRRRRCRREFLFASSSSSTTRPSATVLVTVVSLIACNIAMVYLLYQTLHGNYRHYGGAGRRFLQQREQEQQQWHPSTKRPVIAGGVMNQPILPDNPLYRVPDSMNIVGDRSDAYVSLRKEMDAILPPGDSERSMRALGEIRRHQHQQHRHEQQQREQDQEHPYATFLSPSTTKDEQEANASAAAADGRNGRANDGKSSASVEQRRQERYDVYNCPDEPPGGYPYVWNLMRILEHWPADDVTPRSRVHQGLCVFDYHKDRHKAVAYRAAEVPFVVENDPDVAATAERWNYPGYLDKLLHDSTRHRAEYSENNHFMYYSAPSAAARAGRGDSRHQVPSDWKEPTKQIRMSYSEWIQRANITTTNNNDAKNNEDRSSSSAALLGPNEPHWYFRLIGCGLMGNDGSCDYGSSEFLYDELPFFQPKPSLYITDPDEQKGIHCRFGMKGVIAENHFDGSRNVIAVLGGQRRYVLSHPDQCDKLALYPKGHPSARHSAVDWSDPDLTKYPQFATAMANEVVLEAGQVLYLPTNWFHFIVSLDLNMQCNTRSGTSTEYKTHMRQCGF